jgi:hypothetical protein
MNRGAKIALTWLKNQPEMERINIFSEAFGSKDFADFRNKYGNKIIKNLPFCFIKSYLVRNLETNTVNGKKNLRTEPSAVDDRLKLSSVWMPTGLFSPSRNGSYAPLGCEIECTELIRAFRFKIQEKIMEQAWDNSKLVLRSPKIGAKNEFTLPWLDYDPYLHNNTDVYFILDSSQKRVKIGMSGNIQSRLASLRSQFSGDDLHLIAVIPHGGADIESALHRHFIHHRVEQKGMGKEWFHYTEEMCDFIASLNSYAIRSKFLKAYSII